MIPHPTKSNHTKPTPTNQAHRPGPAQHRRAISPHSPRTLPAISPQSPHNLPALPLHSPRNLPALSPQSLHNLPALSTQSPHIGGTDAIRRQLLSLFFERNKSGAGGPARLTVITPTSELRNSPQAAADPDGEGSLLSKWRGGRREGILVLQNKVQQQQAYKHASMQACVKLSR